MHDSNCGKVFGTVVVIRGAEIVQIISQFLLKTNYFFSLDLYPEKKGLLFFLSQHHLGYFPALLASIKTSSAPPRHPATYPKPAATSPALNARALLNKHSSFLSFLRVSLFPEQNIHPWSHTLFTTFSYFLLSLTFLSHPF